MEAAAPDVVAGRYRVGAVLGRGGMSEVRAGEDLRLGRPVAVKLLRADMAERPELRRRFAAEARAAARLSHPHVVPIYDTGEHDGIPYIVMECLDGRTLADEFAEGPLDQERARDLARQILTALDAAHREGVIHRDVKPGNVLLTADGNVKVADFGIAKVAETHDATTTGVLLGTPSYLAPERVEGEPATAASDIYAVGVLLFEALTATKPFTGDTALAVLHAILRDAPPALAALRPDLDPELVGIIERAMAKDRDARFDSAEDMMHALDSKPGARVAAAHEPTLRIEPEETEETEVALPAPVAPTERVQLTCELRSQPAPDPEVATRPRRSASHAPLPRHWRAIVVAAVIVAGLLVVLPFVRDDGTPARVPPTAPANGPTIPEGLDRAIDQLEQAVRS